MSRQKTTKADIYSARLNPIAQNPREIEAVRLIEEAIARGFNFKQIVVDAVLFANGRTPEMFDGQTPEFDISSASLALINATVKAALKNARFSGNANVLEDDEESDDQELSDFTKNFAQGFIQRRKSAHGDE